MTPVRTVGTRKISNTSQMRKNPGKMVGEADTPETMTDKGKRVCKITEKAPMGGAFGIKAYQLTIACGSH